ncbi:MAG: transposase [Actinobacteria bacterium]|nr:transposase [Actinomycetota bacterium]
MARGKPAGLRLETAERGQSEFQQSSLDDLLSLDHRARQVWDYVERLELGVLYGRVRTTVQSTGRPAIDPAILMSLWLYGTLEGVGSARLLDRLCKSDAAYRWLCGGVSVNYHTLSDFRSEAGPVLDDLLSRSMVGLIASGLVDVQAVAVDGLRVRASAGSGSFRSGERLAELYGAAKEAVEQLRAEVEEDPGSAERRTKARRQAVAEDRLRRLEEAVQAHAEIEDRREEEAREQRRKKPRDDKPARASTTDPQARVMKMGDGGYRPAYNVQITTAAEGAHIIGLSVTNKASDRGLLGPALDEMDRRYEVAPQQMLADGGFDGKDDIERLHAKDIELFCPLPKNGKGDPAAPRRGDKAGTLAWRQRMASDYGQTVYKRRFATERPHAHMRNHGLQRLLVRGINKAKAVLLWHVHAFNFLQLKRLGWA